MSKTHEALTSFHPAIQQWFARRFAGPSAPQVKGWPAIQSGKDTLIAAPTGSGKTLAAFLSCLDSLLRQGLDGALVDETQVVYVSPLKALSNDIQKNLAEPLEEIGGILTGMGLTPPQVRVMVRTGDTPSSDRQSMVRRPPHILVTTPESLYILLTTVKGRETLRNVRTVILDEIHAVAASKRGAHLSLTLERLEALTEQRPTRIGLSATQKPIVEIARFMAGAGRLDHRGDPQCAIVDEGYQRQRDLAIELPGQPLAAVCSNETWEEIYDRLAELIGQQRTTLIFVNTRRLAERLTFHLEKRLEKERITSHHGSLSKEQRLRAEQRLKAGELKALVATASLELGIDIGSVDLVCQIGSPRAISTFLQRVGRSGHSLLATPRGRLFPTTRDDLVECAALFSQVHKGVLDQLSVPEKPLDILAQQIVAAAAVDDWDENELFAAFTRAYPYRNLAREEFDQVVHMLGEGYSTQRGRTSAYLHYDGVNGQIKARKGARLAAVTSGGAIPDNADYDVVLEPQGALVGSVNEDFAIESMAGDIFQLGISSWRILRVEPGKVRVEDAHGLPPSIPFWLGEAPARTNELSQAVSWLREEVGRRVGGAEADLAQAIAWLQEEAGIDRTAAEQAVEYIAAEKAALGVVPTQETLVLERFFDDTGGMQLILHSPFGGRVNRAWGLALRKRFCRTFNFELQAAATEDAIALSLGMQHSFPLEEVFTYLHPATARDVLVQAVLAAPVFQTRWRWNVSRALAVLRMRGGKKVPMPIQRMRSDDLLASIFPAQMACQENLPPDVEAPDHPLVQQALRDCLEEAMNVSGFLDVLERIVEKRVTLVAKDTVEPSPFAHEILNARPYAFLDDAPLEERRTQAVSMRHSLDVDSARDLGRLDPDAIERVREQAWPEPEDPDELHDALMLAGFLTTSEMAPWSDMLGDLLAQGRATRLILHPAPSPSPSPPADKGPGLEAGSGLWIAAERLPMLQAVLSGASNEPAVRVPEREAAVRWTPEDALRETVRARLECLGPVIAASLAASAGVAESAIEIALAALEAEGFALRGDFTGASAPEWCDRRLLARIHRYTLDRLRAEIEPVQAADFLRFLFAWHHVAPDSRLEGPAALVAILDLLEGFEMPLPAWEGHALPSRLRYYDPSWLDQLCLSGELAWARLYPPSSTQSENGDGRRGGNGRKSGATRASPIALVFRENLPTYLSLASGAANPPFKGAAADILDALRQRGASFMQDIARSTRRLPAQVEESLSELVARGVVTSDGFEGLRSLTSPARSRSLHRLRPSQRSLAKTMMAQRRGAGRWSLLDRGPENPQEPMDEAEATEFLARKLLRRYGVVFHRLLLREPHAPPWRDLLRVYRRLEARGEIRGGRFVAGFSGEQYALPHAISQLRAARRVKPNGAVVTVSGADPLNLAGILTPGQRVPALPTNRVTYRDGTPESVEISGYVSHLETRGADLAPSER